MKTMSGAAKSNESDLVRFMLAGTSNMSAACITNPIDVIKIRLQLDNELRSTKVTSQSAGGAKLNTSDQRYYKGMIRGIVSIVRDEGIRGLYKGLPASLMREGSYSTIRLGAYEPMKRLMGATDPSHTPLWKKICAGAASGAIGSSIATPTDLVKVRMQACTSSSKPSANTATISSTNGTPVYTSTLGAFRSIYTEGGVTALYRGVGPTVLRATILTATQIPTYDHVKHTLLNWGWFKGEGLDLHVTASMIAGLASAATTSPVDVVKTRYMRQIHRS